MTRIRCTRGACNGNLFHEPERGWICGWCGVEYGAPEPTLITKLLSNCTPETKQSSGMRVSADTAAIVMRVRAQLERLDALKPGRPARKLCAAGHDDWRVKPGGGRECRTCRREYGQGLRMSFRSGGGK